jgi:type I restriction enzyme S subunit
MSTATTHIKTEKRSAERSRSKLFPALRFKEFEGNYSNRILKDFTKINQGLQIPISERYSEQVEGSYFYITNEFLRKGSKKSYFIKNPTDSVICFEDDILMTRTGNTGQVVTGVHGAFHNNFFKIKFDESCEKWYLYFFLTSYRTQHKILTLAGTSTIPDLNHGDFYKLKITMPKYPEQQKIASFLSAVDKKIQQLTKKKSLLEQYKKGVMQQLFPSTGSGQRSGQLRFKDANGKAYPDWEDTLLGDCLKYVQPTKYLVSSTEYDNSFETPVLTAGKTFVLGYTDEKENICTDYPLIIFDDFTTASKYVDFPFKAKSSAMKLLLAKEGVDVKFMFEAMQNIKFEVGGHGRHWISIFSQLVVSVPSINEQQKIATYLSSIDNKIAAVNTQITQTQTFKKGLLQQMFV